MAADFIPLTGRIVLQEQHSSCSPRPRRPHLHDKVGACAASPWRVEVCRSQLPPSGAPLYAGAPLCAGAPCFHALWVAFNEASSCWLLFCCPEPASGMRCLGMTVELSGIPWQYPEKGGFH